MKNHTRRPRTDYEALYQRRLDEGLTYATLSADSSVPVATLQYWFRRFKVSVRCASEAGAIQSDERS